MCLRSSHGWCSREKLTGKFQILITSGKTTIFSGQQQSQANNFIKKETLAQVFSCEYSEMLQNIFLKEYVRWLLLVFIIRRKVFYIKRKQLFSEESAKLRALRAIVPCVLCALRIRGPHVSCAFIIFHWLLVPRVVRAFLVLLSHFLQVFQVQHIQMHFMFCSFQVLLFLVFLVLELFEFFTIDCTKVNHCKMLFIKKRAP